MKPSEIKLALFTFFDYFSCKGKILLGERDALCETGTWSNSRSLGMS